ncbi:MAG TPA: YdcF family protein [Myxococcales bacterium]|nr:YdcF family protein [Myxococcales bacterium]
MPLDPPHGLHGILVFGAAVDEDGALLPPLVRRLRQALAEASADPRALVVVSGGSVRGRPAEAPIMRDWLVAQGLASTRIILETEATSTYENASQCADLVARHGFQSVTLVSERFHVLRSRFLLRRALAGRDLGVELRVSAAPDDLRALEALKRRLVELWKLLKDTVRAPP